VRFWQNLQALLEQHEVVIDRPGGTTHPRYPGFVYPFDYGYLKGTSGGDGQGIDVWMGSGDRRRLTGVICTVDTVKCDAEVKLLAGCTRAEAEEIERVHNSGPQGGLLIWRD
jgi:inorganic pyrophosphatase